MAKVQHLPLGRALQEYAGEKNKPLLLALLLPLQKAAAQSILIKELVDTNEIFQPLAWRISQAHHFLQDIPFFESEGIVVRVPNWWNVKKPPRPQISISIGKETTSQLGLDALLDFEMHFALNNGEQLTPQEWQDILNATENLIKIKGQWVEVNRDKLQQVLSHWKTIQRQVKEGGLTFSEGMRLLSGTTNSFSDQIDLAEKITQWSHIEAGTWLKETLNRLRNPQYSNTDILSPIFKKYLKATLRPYQLTGVQWLWLLYNLQLGGCLADDMGLGKTIQMLSLLLVIKHQQQHLHPHLLIVPASLVGNWQAEIKRFAPDLTLWIAHSSVNNETKKPTSLSHLDLVMTTYSFVHRLTWLTEIQWDVLILDEAQNIKNPSAKQTHAVKALKARVRFALTGTPIENRLSDLWSLFDFAAPGLLGSSKTFSTYSKKFNNKTSEQRSADFYRTIRTLVSPYILRRLKSNKTIIADLPDKTELTAFCTLTKQQAGLYQQAVADLSQRLQTVDDSIVRRGVVLSYLLRFKQICNHPSQWLGHGNYDNKESGKFFRLREICEEVAAKQEKVLVFTQFREIIPALSEFLAMIFNREGLVLHGGTAIKQRMQLVETFQQEQGPPFMVLSLKAGGTGLNLTRAAHVIHFDRWWNPAVENQATDRAYRIGQKKNVLVHKFICRGTIEEKIDALITAKKTLSNEILHSGNEIQLTELNDKDLIDLVSLDIHRALSE
jgi:non-specific serine/threonine protein kinase